MARHHEPTRVSLDDETLARAEQVAEAAAREAGELLLSWYGRLDRAEIRSKGAARDLVTRAEVESERAIVARLRAAFPGHEIEAEEEARDELGAAPRWFVDPLDGTVNFVHGVPAFTVSIALYEGRTPLVGVVHAPRLGETFVARRGAGARLTTEFRGELGPPRPLSCSRATTLAESVVATGFPYRRGELEHDNVENFAAIVRDVRGIRRLGSAALDLAYTAAGRFDGFWELHLSPHDVAAGALLVREAGGRVSDAAGGDEWLRGGHLVAGSPALVPLLAERLRF